MSFPILSSVRARFGAVALASCILSASAFAGTPRVSHIYPGGAQRGGEMDITLTGTNLADARSFVFDEPGFEAKVLTAEGGKVTAKVKVAPNVRLGEHTLHVITSSGVSDLRVFYITPFPMVEEVAVKQKVKPPQHIELNTTVYGHTPDDDRDTYEVDLKKGQRLSVEVIGLRLHTQTPYDPFLSITKADGTEIIEVDDTGFSRQDPVASILAPEDGKYLITVRDTTNIGPGQCQYIMNIGTFARPTAVYPAGGPAGENLKVKLIGDASGVIEQTVKLPDKEDDKFLLYTVQDQSTPQPNVMRVSHLVNVLESEPNNDTQHATIVNQDLPVALNGIIEQKDDVDFFQFHAKKGQQFDFTVWARRLGTPLDSVLEIYNDKGAKIGTNDDAGGPDSYLRWNAPADGEFYVSVRDQLGRGGPNYVYRLEITAIEPKLTAWLPEMTINQNQDRRAIAVPKGNRYASLVRIKRQDVAGEVKIEPVALLDGVTTSAPNIDKSVDTIPMVFEASAEAPVAAKDFELIPQLAEPPKDGPKVSAKVDHAVDVMEYNNQRSFYILHERNIPVAVTDEIPVKITLTQPKVPLLQTGSMGLKVTAERKGDFKGQVTIGLLYSPPGIGNAGLQQIKEGETEGTVTISANANAPLQKWKLCVVGSADFGKGPVWFSTQLVEVEVAAPMVGGKLARTFVDQGDSTTMTVALDQKTPFEGKAKLQLLGLPPNCTADEQEFTKDDKEVKFTIKADKSAPAGQHKQLFCQFNLQKDGESMTSTFGQGGILRVDKATVAKNDAAPAPAAAETAKK
jgi:hypothetical protein